VTRPLIHLAEVDLGRQRSPEHERGDYMVRYLRSANVGDGVILLDDVKEMNFSPQEQARFAIHDGDVLVTEGSGSRETVGQSAVWHEDIAGVVCFQNALLRIRPRVGLADGRFLAWWARHAHASRLMAAGASGANILHLSAEQLRRLPVPDLDLALQGRVAEFLDDQVARIDNIVAARRAQIALVTAARQSVIIRCLLAGGDLAGTAGAAWYRRLPSSWPLRPLRAAWQVIDCKHRTPAYVEVGYPVVSPGDISPGPLDLRRCNRFIEEADYADLADALRRCRLGDIVYSRNASAGTAALVTTDEPFTMGQDVCRITSPRPSQRYLYYLLNFAVAPQLEAARVGSTFTRINIDEIKALRVPVPPDIAQERISSDVDAVSAEFATVLATQARQISLMDELKRSLITAAVTGEFDVSSADGSRIPA
jgi:type I restriction enzyme S subunit